MRTGGISGIGMDLRIIACFIPHGLTMFISMCEVIIHEDSLTCGELALPSGLAYLWGQYISPQLSALNIMSCDLCIPNNAFVGQNICLFILLEEQ